MTRPSQYFRLLAALAVATTLIVSGCASVSFDPAEVRTAQEALSAASEYNEFAEAQRFLLRSADQFQRDDDHGGARTLLRSEMLESPAQELNDQYRLLAMRSAVALEDHDWAEVLARDIPVDQYQQYPDELRAEAVRLQSRLFELARAHLKSALTLISHSAGTDTGADDSINDRIWQALKRTPDAALAQAAASAIGFETQGWLELASTLRSPGLPLKEQARAIREWQRNWLGHPAADNLPSELILISRLVEERPARIALALPLSGPLASAGAMVRDGFMAAFYAAEDSEKSSVRITVTDTHDRAFSDVFNELVESRPDLIVGPLEKDALAALASSDSLPVPVLALNYLPQSDSRVPAQLSQFGLSAEDEARQIANRLSAEGLDQVLALIPEGDWGNRVESALATQLQDNGGRLLNVDRYFSSDNLRSVTADILGINVSRQRAIEVERTIGLNVEFEPRRRQDVDAIVMVAQPNIARQFKPLFAFYYAGDLPVYSPSLIYEGKPDPSRDRDLNQVRFTDLPWVLNTDTPFRSTARKVFPGTDGQLGRLFAMGADAWALSSRLPLLRQVEGSSLEGHTGTLTMTPDGRVQRRQLWAYFDEGTPRLLPTVAPREMTEDPDPVGPGEDSGN